MFKFNKTLLKYVLVSALFVLAGTAAAATNEATATPAATVNKNANYLFIQGAKSAELQPADATTGTYTLTLTGVRPYVTYFSDRPNRISGLLKTEKFMGEWTKDGKSSFLKDAPNVGLEGTKMHGIIGTEDKSVILVLSNPTYDSKKDTATYTAKLLENGKAIMSNKPIKLKNVELFFDSLNMCFGCG